MDDLGDALDGRYAVVHRAVAVRQDGDDVVMAAALERVAGNEVAALIDWTPDPAIAGIVTSWPAHIHTTRAAGLGLLPEKSFDDIIRAYVSENPYAVKVPVR